MPIPDLMGYLISWVLRQVRSEEDKYGALQNILLSAAPEVESKPKTLHKIPTPPSISDAYNGSVPSMTNKPGVSRDRVSLSTRVVIFGCSITQTLQKTLRSFKGSETLILSP